MIALSASTARLRKKRTMRFVESSCSRRFTSQGSSKRPTQMSSHLSLPAHNLKIPAQYLEAFCSSKIIQKKWTRFLKALLTSSKPIRAKSSSSLRLWFRPMSRKLMQESAVSQEAQLSATAKRRRRSRMMKKIISIRDA